MKLKSMQVKNFKCLEDSTRFDICPVTCLVGKNEAGKTSLLEALHKLNPDVSEMGEFDVLLEYPRRRRKEYQRRAKTEPDDALITRWELEEKDVEIIEQKLGSGVVKSRNIEVCKGYYPGQRWIFEGGQSSEENIIPAPVQAVMEKLLPKFLYFSKCSILNGRIAIDTIIRNQERGCLSGPERIFLALLDLVGTKPEHLTSIANSEELIADLEAASAPITEQISRYWSQNTSLRVSFQLHSGKPQDPPPFDKGQVFETRILNTRHNLTLNFDERSTGFVWFFSFLVWFWQVKRTLGDNLLILLDDPGIGLHARAQQDLLRYISMELEPHYQVIYTTHSPFMVDPNNLERARTVEDVVVIGNKGYEEYLGTKVGDKTFSTDPDTLIPLRAALGYEYTRLLAGKQKTLLVNDPVEALYLGWFSSRLKEKGRTGLGPEWKIVPCGGAEKIGAFLGLFEANKDNVTVLMETKEDKLSTRNEQQLLNGCGVIEMSNHIDGHKGGIEDLIGRRTYFGLVNLCYKLPKRSRLPLATNAPDAITGQSKRLIDQVEEHFASPASSIGTFDRNRPAEFLMENTKRCKRKLPDLSVALDRFERLFCEINSAQSHRQETRAPLSVPAGAHPIADIGSGKKLSPLPETEIVS